MFSSGGMLTPDELRVAKSRTVKEWGDIYMHIIEAELKRLEIANPEGHALAFSNYTTSIRPGIRRILSAFESAGLNLSDEMEFEGPIVLPPTADGMPPSIVWPNPTVPRITYYWPDKSELTFTGDDALRSVNFFMFWQNYQQPVLGAGRHAGERRIIMPGEAEYDQYMAAKNADQKNGQEP